MRRSLPELRPGAIEREHPPEPVTEAQVDELWAEAEAELARREDEVRQKKVKVTQA